MLLVAVYEGGRENAVRAGKEDVEDLVVDDASELLRDRGQERVLVQHRTDLPHDGQKVGQDLAREGLGLQRRRLLQDPVIVSRALAAAGRVDYGAMDVRLPMEIEDIKKVLPHRHPFLFLDRILEFEEDKRIVGIKNVSSDERYFLAGPGGVPMMPAFILTEALAQTGAVLILAKPENRSRLIYFMGIDRVRYRRPVVAGDSLNLEATVLRLRSKMGTLRGIARVDGKVVGEGVMMFALGDPVA